MFRINLFAGLFFLFLIGSSIADTFNGEAITINLNEGQNILLLKLINTSATEMESLTVDVPLHRVPSWLSVKLLKQSVCIPPVNISRPIDVTLCLYVTDAAIGESALLTLVLKQDKMLIGKTQIAIRVIQNGELPKEYRLLQNYPNPFNSSTAITFALPKSSDISLQVFNVKGEEVKKLLQNYKSAGYHTVHWDCKDNCGREVSAGVYWYRMEASEFFESKSMLFVK